MGLRRKQDWQCGVALALVLSCTTNMQTPVAPDEPNAYRIVNVKAAYDDNDDIIRVSWPPPETGANSRLLQYYVFRIWNNREELCDSVAHVDGQERIEYGDCPAVGNGWHLYRIAAQVVEYATGFAFRGCKSDPPCSVYVPDRSGVLRINNGASFTATNRVSLNLSPVSIFQSFAVDTTNGVRVIKTYDLESIQRMGMAGDTMAVADIMLPQGGGVKEVNVAAVNIDGDTIRLSNFIHIQSSKVKIRIQNQDLTKKMDRGWWAKVSTQKKIQFSLDCFGDTTLSDKAMVWVAVPTGGGKSAFLADYILESWFPPSPDKPWLETSPQEIQLNLGNEEQIYEYDLGDPDNLKTCARSAACLYHSVNPVTIAQYPPADSMPKEVGAYWGVTPTTAGLAFDALKRNVRYTSGEMADSVFFLLP